MKIVKYTRRTHPWAFIKSDPDVFWVEKDRFGRSIKFHTKEPQYPQRARVRGNKYIRHSVKHITRGI